MNLLSIDEKTAMTTPYLQQAGLSPDPEKVKQIVAAAADRIKVAGDILEYTTFFIPAEQLIYDEVAFDKRLQTPPEAAGLLKRFADRLKTLEPFDAPTIEKDLQDFVQAEGVTHAQIIHSLRLAATGKTVGFGLFDTLAILGRTESLRRIEQALGRI